MKHLITIVAACVASYAISTPLAALASKGPENRRRSAPPVKIEARAPAVVVAYNFEPAATSDVVTVAVPDFIPAREVVAARIQAKDYASVAKIVAAAIALHDLARIDEILATVYEVGGVEAVAEIMAQMAHLPSCPIANATSVATNVATAFYPADMAEKHTVNRWDVMSGFVPHSKQWALWRIGMYREANGENADDIWNTLMEYLRKTEGKQ